MEPKILYCSHRRFELPLGRAEILVPDADLTLLTWGTPVYHCETALGLLAGPSASLAPLAPLAPESIRNDWVELIDLRTVLPWDIETVLESVKRTGRLVVVHEASRTAVLVPKSQGRYSPRHCCRWAPPFGVLPVGSKCSIYPLWVNLVC
jgi:2-oxoisovalerate dehydrogenase E1 component beta subunit